MEQSKVFEKYQRKAEGFMNNSKKRQRLLHITGKKLQAVIDRSPELKALIEQMQVMLRMIKAHLSGRYKAFSRHTLAMMIGAFVYFVTPIDLIPDFIPVLGLLDDASIVYWVYQSIHTDIEKFLSWENTLEA